MARQIPNINSGNFLIQRERLAFKQFVLKVNTDTFIYTYNPNTLVLDETGRLLTLTLLNKKFIFDLLQIDGTLPEKYKSHKLSGNYADCWECHIKSDWLLV